MNVTDYGSSHWVHTGRVSMPRTWRQGDCPGCGAEDRRLVLLEGRLGAPRYVCPPCRAQEER